MKKIGYLKVYIKDEKHVGGIMIADERGIPIEFKYTEPIEPTKLQKVLYGDVLEKYLLEEVIINNLVAKIENKPKLFLVDDVKNYCLNNFVKEDVAVLKKTQLKPLKDEKRFNVIKETEAVVQISEEGAPVRIITTCENKEEFIKYLLEAGSDFDISEPFNRIEEALKLICNGEL